MRSHKTLYYQFEKEVILRLQSLPFFLRTITKREITMGERSRWRYFIVCGLLCQFLLGCGLFMEKIPEGQTIGTGPDDHFVTVGDIRYHYREYPAEGKDILLIHGFASSTYTWEKVAPQLQKLGYHIWALDMKGFGWSDKPKGAAYDPVTLTEEVSQWMDAVGLSEAVFVGNSLGGGIAALMAIIHPYKIGSLVLIDAAAYNTKFPFIMKMARMPLAADVMKLFFSPWLVRRTLSEVYYHGDWITDEQVRAYYDRGRTKHALDAQIAVTKALEFKKFERFVNRIPEIELKALVIWGEKDRWIPLESAYRFNSEIRHSKLVVIPECGHIPQEEFPDLTAKLIAAFLEGKPVEELLPMDTGMYMAVH
jgi:pimeloyl-ACP methyl ester carboxylesterase